MAKDIDLEEDFLDDVAGENDVDKFDPTKQFSKKLAWLGAIIWSVYSFALLALVAYRPEAAMACVWLTLIMTANKALDTLSYTRNSVTEKVLLAGIERTKFELSLKGLGKGIAGTHVDKGQDDSDGDSDDDPDDDEVSNG